MFFTSKRTRQYCEPGVASNVAYPDPTLDRPHCIETTSILSPSATAMRLMLVVLDGGTVTAGARVVVGVGTVDVVTAAAVVGVIDWDLFTTSESASVDLGCVIRYPPNITTAKRTTTHSKTIAGRTAWVFRSEDVTCQR